MNLLRPVALMEDGILHCDWDGSFHWDPRYRRLRHLNGRQAWSVDVAGRIINPTRVQNILEPRLRRRSIHLPKLP
ncbi:MAG: hypothetical protein H7Y22_19100 [Gemmatimonadaceae bacterium]|nr:hypothetical protein [Gloeobacterales cyanobacterium ES-bin-141]